MSATVVYPNISRARRAFRISHLRSLIIASLVLIAGPILVIVLSPIQDWYRVETIPVAIPVPTPLITDIQPSPLQTPGPSAGVISEPSVVPVPVPTPPTP